MAVWLGCATGLKQHWKDERIDAMFKDGVIFADTRILARFHLLVHTPR